MNNSNAIERIRKGLIYFVFAVFFYSHSVGLILVLLFFLWATGEFLFRKKPSITVNGYVILLIIFILWCLFVSTVLSTGNLKRIGKFIYYLPLLLSPWFALKEKNIRTISIISVLVLVIGFPLSIALTKNFSVYTIGNFPILGHHIPLAQHLSSLSLISLAIFLTIKTHPKERVLWLLATVLLVVYVFLTGSRSFYIALPLSGLMMVWYLDRRKTVYFMILLIILAVLTAIIFPDFVERFKTIFDTKKFSSNTERLKMWILSLKVITMNLKNFFVGVGLEGWTISFPETIKSKFPYWMSLYKTTHVHNLYLQWWIETGLVGLSLYLGFLFLILKALYRKFNSLTNSYSRAYTIGVFFSVLCYMIGGLFDFLQMPRTLLSVYLFVSAALSIEDGKLQKDSR